MCGCVYIYIYIHMYILMYRYLLIHASRRRARGSALMPANPSSASWAPARRLPPVV